MTGFQVACPVWTLIWTRDRVQFAGLRTALCCKSPKDQESLHGSGRREHVDLQRGSGQIGNVSVVFEITLGSTATTETANVEEQPCRLCRRFESPRRIRPSRTARNGSPSAMAINSFVCGIGSTKRAPFATPRSRSWSKQLLSRPEHARLSHFESRQPIGQTEPHRLSRRPVGLSQTGVV